MATIKDVARVAGVSVTTVSRALNNYDDVNVNTKEHIVKVAKELNYVPNRAARNLVKKENTTLAFILSGLMKDGGRDNIVYRLLAGMYAFAETIDYDVALFTTDSAHQKKKSYVDFCLEHNIGGAVITGIRLDDPYLRDLFKSGTPCVLVDVDMDSDNVSSISINNEQASREAVQMLINHNHRRIGCIVGREEADVTIKRLAGYGMALKDNQIPYDEDIVVCGDFLEDKAYEAASQLLEQDSDITAIYCFSDMMALGAIRAAHDKGLSVPEDISILGFDDIPLAEYLNPPLGTVQQDFYEMGYHAARQLLRMAKDESRGKKIFIEHKVLARGTVRMI